MLKSINQETKPLAERVAEQIQNLIAGQSLKTGDKLPNEFEMAKELNVGRGTIREAVKILVSRNILEIRRGCGTFVCEKPGLTEDPLGLCFVSDKKKLTEDLGEVRIMIEPSMAALAAEHATAEEIKKIQELADEIESLIREGKSHMEKDIEFHEFLAVSSKNLVMPNLVPVIHSAIPLFIEQTDKELQGETIRTHRKIVNAIKKRDPKEAKAAMLEHLTINQEKLKELYARKQFVKGNAITGTKG